MRYIVTANIEIEAANEDQCLATLVSYLFRKFKNIDLETEHIIQGSASVEPMFIDAPADSGTHHPDPS